MVVMRIAATLLFALLAPLLPAQVIEFESGGLKYQTLTKGGVTIMYAHLAATVRDYVTIQVAVSNGTRQPVIIRPEDFTWNPESGPAIHPVAARIVVREMLSKARRDDVVGLVGAYENGLYGLQQLRSSTGYEARRRAALAEVESAKLKAAAAASAIAFVQMKLAPGETTDGALFFNTMARPLPPGILKVICGNQLFEFILTESTPQLKTR
jgi:hypothetical protein